MQIKNISTRLVTIGNYLSIPAETITIDDKHAADIAGMDELEVVKEEVKRGRPAKVAVEESAATEE